MGRDKKLTKKLRENFCDAISLGLSYIDACHQVGVSRQSWQVWKTKGKEGGKENKVYRDFVIDVKQAFVTYKLKLLKDLSVQSDYRAQLKLLERADKHIEQLEMDDTLDVTLLHPSEIGVLCYLHAKCRGLDPDRNDFKVISMEDGLLLSEKCL